MSKIWLEEIEHMGINELRITIASRGIFFCVPKVTVSEFFP